jgi:hypothetical protein
MKITFDDDQSPFKPLELLMSVFPAARFVAWLSCKYNHAHILQLPAYSRTVSQAHA